ncbi:hypothetical protein B0H19DRAFT_174264 [Mycena capillaripes]|nr:hypothetical protein B0H19DRAFT_174264 [Mycena capillaripes]
MRPVASIARAILQLVGLKAPARFGFYFILLGEVKAVRGDRLGFWLRFKIRFWPRFWDENRSKARIGLNRCSSSGGGTTSESPILASILMTDRFCWSNHPPELMPESAAESIRKRVGQS